MIMIRIWHVLIIWLIVVDVGKGIEIWKWKALKWKLRELEERKLWELWIGRHRIIIIAAGPPDVIVTIFDLRLQIIHSTCE